MHGISIDKNNALWIGIYNENTNTNPSAQNSILKIDVNTWEFCCNKNARPNHYVLDNNCKQLVSDQSSNFEGEYGSIVSIDGNGNKWMVAIGNGGTNLGVSKFNDQIWKTYNSINSEINGYVGSIITSLNSKKVFIGNNLVYEDCRLPLNIEALINLSSNTISISNEGNNHFLIQSEQKIDGLILMNINGTEIRNETAKTNRVMVDYSGYASGLYLMKVIFNNQVTTKKLKIE